MNEKLEEMRSLSHKNIEKAKEIEARRLSGIQRLKKFPILTRILLYPKFNKIRRIIHEREMYRSGLVVTALGMTRAVRLIERKLRAQSNRGDA